jgi:hypothetical protein
MVIVGEEIQMPLIRGNKSLQINKPSGSVLGVGFQACGRHFERAHQTSFSLPTPVVNDKGPSFAQILRRDAAGLSECGSGTSVSGV